MKKRTKKDIPKDETKAVRFVRVVTPRVSKAVKAIRTIGFCASPAYEYTPKQIQQICSVLIATTNSMNDKFSKKASDKPAGFAFKE